MSREGKKLQHIHSSVPNKQPKPSILEVGELAVNNAAGNEFISTKNTDDEVVRFSSDKKVVSIIENKTVMPYKGEVLEPTEQDLIDNKSQIVIGLNQVAAKETFGYDQVNGAEDMHGDAINPSEDGGKTNGAGFAINMDRYAMIGANPSFSSVTTNSMLSEDKLFIGNNEALEDGVDMPEVSVYGSSIKLHAEGGKVGITAGDEINISGTNDGNFNVENNMCIGAGNEMKIGAVEKLTIGEDCSGTETSVVEIKGGEVIINREATSNLSATTVEGALEELAEKVAAAGDGYITGGHVDSGSGIISVDVLGQAGATIDGLEEYINNRLGDISGIAKRSEVTKETIGDVDKVVVKFFDKDDNELEDLQIVLDDYYNKGEINDMELVIAAALNDLNDRVLDISGSVITLEGDVEELKNRRDNFVTDGEVDEDSGIIYLNMSESDEPAEVTGLAEYVEGKVSALSGDTNDYVTGGSVNSNTGIINLNVKNQGSYPVTGLAEYVSGQTNGLFSNVEYVSSSETIVFKDKDGDVVGTVDASRFVMDGMVLSVVVDTPTGGTHAGVECLIITWNDDASPEVDPLVTEIPLSKFFDPAVLDNYYTKQEINTMLGEDFIDFSGQNFSSITEVIRSNELVTAAALNDLNDRVIEVSGDVITNTNNIENLDGRVTVLEGKQDKYVASGSFDSGTVTLTMSDGTSVYITGISTGEGADGNDYVTGGTVNADGTITLNIKGGNTATISGLSDYLANNDKYVSGGSVDANSGAITLKLKNGNDVTLTGLSAYVSAHDTNDYVTGGSVNENTGAITLNMKSGGTATVTGLNDYVSSHDKYVTSGHVDSGTGRIVLVVKEGDNVNVDGLSAYLNGKIAAVSGDTNDYVTGGSVNNETGIITLEISGGKGSASVTGLNEYINGKTSGFSTTDIQVNGGSVNASDGVITLTRTDSKNPSSTVPSVTIDGLAAYVSSVTPADVWVNTSGDTMTGVLTFKNGNNTVMTVDPTVNDVLDVSANAKISGTLTIDGSDVLIDPASRMYWTGATLPQDPREDYGFVQGIDRRTSLDEFLLPSGGTANSGKTVTIGSDGKWQLSEDKWVHLTGNETIRGNKTFNGLTRINEDVVIGLNYENSGVSVVHSVNRGNTDPRDDFDVFATSEENNNDGLGSYLLPSATNLDDGKIGMVVNDRWEAVNASWLPLSGGTVTGDVTFGSGSNKLTISPTGNFIHSLGEVDGADGLTIFHDDVEIDYPAILYGSVPNPSEPREDYDFIEGSAYNTKLSQFLLPSGGTANSGKIAMVNSSGEWTLSNGNWVDESGDTMTGSLVFRPSGQLSNTIALVASNGNITCMGNVTAAGSMYSSDKRLKENIKFIPNDDLENAKKIDFKEFNFIADKSSQKVGVIAQELKENGLGKLTKQNDAGYLTVDYISLLCLKIAQLEKEIKELKEGK